MAKPNRAVASHVRGAGKPSPVQPQWGKIGDINFKWKNFVGHRHTDAEVQELEEILRSHFRKIGLIGDLTVFPRAQKNGSSDTKGLTVVRSLGNQNDISFAYQPGDTNSRFVYSINFPSRIVRDVHTKLMASVDEERNAKVSKETPLTEAGIVAANMAAVTGAMMDMATHAMDVMLHPAQSQASDTSALVHGEFPTHEFNDAAGELIILQLRFDLAGVSTEALCRDLEEVLTKYGPGEAIFMIKRNSNVHTFPQKDDSYGIKWCPLQPGSRGIGFFYRADAKHAWEKFALVPDAAFGFDLQRFSETVAGNPSHLSVIAGGKGGIVAAKKPTGVNDYAGDELGAMYVLIHMSRAMLKDRLQLLPARVVTELFRNHVTGDVNAGAIGRIFTHWEDNGWVKRIKDGYKVEYTLGEKAGKLLPDTDLDMYHILYPRRRKIFEEVSTMPKVHEVQPSVVAEVAEIVQVTEIVQSTAESNVAPVAVAAVPDTALQAGVPDYETLANKLQGVLTRLRSVEVIKDEISGFDISIDAVEAEIAVLEAKRTALAEGRAAAFARLPTTEELQKMQLLASML